LQQISPKIFGTTLSPMQEYSCAWAQKQLSSLSFTYFALFRRVTISSFKSLMASPLILLDYSSRRHDSYQLYTAVYSLNLERNAILSNTSNELFTVLHYRLLSSYYEQDTYSCLL